MHNVRAVTRALTILRSFSASPQQSLAEVTAATNLDKGTTRRLLLTLADNGFILFDQSAQKYRLGGAIRELAMSVADAPDLRSLASSILSQLAAELHMTAFLSVYDDGHAICLDRLHDMKGIEVRWWAVGGSMPYNCGAAPKLLLAFQGDEEIEKVLATPPVAMTAKSTVDAGELRRQLALVRKRGWSLAVDDVALGLAALAAPVFDKQGALICAISVSGLTPELVSRGKPRHVDALLKAAGTIERQLHHAPA